MHFSVNQKLLFLSYAIAKAHKNGRKSGQDCKNIPKIC